MMMPQQWEAVAQERERDWEKLMKNRQLLAELPTKPPRWQRWAGNLLVWAGDWMTLWGARFAQRVPQENV